MKFRFAQWSDPHEFINGSDLTNVLLNSIPEIDAKVCTGDVVKEHFGQDIYYAQLENSLTVVGNHDMVSAAGANPSGYDWYKQPSASELYNKFFLPYKDIWGITMSENTSWWNKDYPEKKVAIVGLNSCTIGIQSSNQKLWLKSLLDRYINDEYSVIFVSHYSPALSITRSLFTSRNYFFEHNYFPDMGTRNMYKFIDESRTIINDAYDKGLNVVGIFSGHEHSDGFYSGDYPMFIVGSTKIDEYNDVNRSYGNNTGCCSVNLYEYDTHQNTITVYRLGADKMKDGNIRKMLVWSYSSKSIVAQCGA